MNAKEDMRKSVNQILEKNKENLLNSLSELIGIPSVEGVSTADEPFGPGPAHALKQYLAMGKSMGFETGQAGGYAGHILWNSKGETAPSEDVGILVHLDVVPADENSWTYPPFSGTITGDRIYGRGSQDDKGPAVAALYAMKALKDAGFQPERGIRLIAGTNEETGSADIPKYLEIFPQPAWSIVPDGCYPVVHGEKGIMDIRLIYPLSRSSVPLPAVKEFHGGTARNMVPDYCRLLLEDSPLNIAELTALIPKDLQSNISLTERETGILFESHGKSVHGAQPEKGLNAVFLMMRFLALLPFKSTLSEFSEIFNRRFSEDYFGRKLECNYSDTASGQLRINAGLIEMKEDRIILDLNLRYPVTADGKKIFEIIRSNIMAEGMTAKLLIDSKPLFFPEDNPFIQMLRRKYIQETGDKETLPLVIGGGTYARTLKNAAAIGGKSPSSIDLAHQTDEYILIEDLMSSARIYGAIIMEMAE